MIFHILPVIYCPWEKTHNIFSSYPCEYIECVIYFYFFLCFFFHVTHGNKYIDCSQVDFFLKDGSNPGMTSSWEIYMACKT